jgi:hypothetical protein
MPDGAFFFNEANSESLSVDIKINDLRSFELHSGNGITKIAIKDPLKNNSTYQTYYTITEGMLNTIDMMSTAYVKEVTKNPSIP